MFFLKKAKDHIEEFLEIVLGSHCFNCNTPGPLLCQDCFFLIPFANHVSYLDKRSFFPLYFATDYKEPLPKNLIHHLKYPPYLRKLSYFLALAIFSYLTQLPSLPPFLVNPKEYLLVPIPSHPLREKERGFNPPTLITKHLSQMLEIEWQELLRKRRKTAPQTTLQSKKEREENIKNSFQVHLRPSFSKEKQVLLVDDVCTTGATLREAKRTLQQVGYEVVGALVFARD